MNMGLELMTISVAEAPKNSEKTASDVFNFCPRCQSTTLIECLGDVICSRCDWNSIGISADAQLESSMRTTRLRRQKLTTSERIGRHGRKIKPVTRERSDSLDPATSSKPKSRRSSLKDRIAGNPMIEI